MIEVDISEFSSLFLILEALETLRDILLPFAIAIAIYALLYQIWHYFVNDDNENKISTGTLVHFALRIGRPVVLPFVLFLLFPKICIFPAMLMSYLIDEVREIDPIEELANEKIAPITKKITKDRLFEYTKKA